MTRFAFLAATAGALVATIAFLGWQSDPRLIVPPAVAALLASVQIAYARRSLGLTLPILVVATVSSAALAQSAHADSVAMVAVVILSALGSVFTRVRLMGFLIIGSMIMTATPLLLSVDRWLLVGVSMSLAFLAASLAVKIVADTQMLLASEHRTIFERAPVGLMDQDWSEALRLLPEPGTCSPEDLRSALAADSDLLGAVIANIETIRVNAAACELWKLPPERLTGHIPETHVAASGGLRTWIDRIVNLWSGSKDELDYPATVYDGTHRWLGVRNVVADSGSGRVIVAFQDVTARKARTLALAELVDAKDRFVATISHELKNPLTGVIGLVEALVQSDDFERAEQEALLALVSDQAHEIGYLVEDLLVGARADIGRVTIEVEQCNLVELAATVVDSAQIPATLDHLPDVVLVRADALRVRQVIRNLLVNADRYGGTDRRIVVRDDGEAAYLEMRDSGAALPPSDQQLIFEPYSQSRHRTAAPGSTGLGLAVSRKLAELMGGSLDYHHDGSESVFRLELPADGAHSHAGGAQSVGQA